MNYLLAIFPIVSIIFLMILLHWGGQKAGPAGWAIGILIAVLFFGLTPDVFLVSQAKGLLLSVYVLMVLWPALLLYNAVNSIGGISALAGGLRQVIQDHRLLLIVLAWAFSGLLEGLAGFGLPVAVVSPMLVSLGVPPVQAVAAVAVGHSWSVTFGDMGVIFQTLIGVSQMDPGQLVAPAATILGITCLFCGIATALIISSKFDQSEVRSGIRLNIYIKIVIIAIVMAFTQYTLAVIGLSPLAGLGAGALGVLSGIIFGWGRGRTGQPGFSISRSLKIALTSYGSLTLLMVILAFQGPIRSTLEKVIWKPTFGLVKTTASYGMPAGFTSPAAAGQVFRFLLHPGTSIFLIALLTIFFLQKETDCKPGEWKNIFIRTWKSAAPASLGIIFTVGLSTLMDHTGMTMLLARGLSEQMKSVYPIVSPLVGSLGAFATGSNNNSNVLFASLQKNIAILLQLSPAWLLAAQTAGGSLGSMIAPAKIIVGCSTTGIQGKDGAVLKITLPFGISIALLTGILVWIITKMF
jgi:lactate permease